MTEVTDRIGKTRPRRFRPYPEYRDSGVEWLGEIPAHWKVQPLKHLVTFSTGWTPPTGREDLYGGKHLWANISDLGPKVLDTTENTISDMAIREARLRIVEAGSLLFSFKLSVGTVSIAGVNMYTNEAIAAFNPSSLIDTRYLFWAAPILIPCNAQVNIYGAPLLNRERIANAKLLRFAPSEQHAIAAFLDRETARIDGLVARKERLVELLQEKRTALITRAVTRGLDPNVPMKDSGVEWLGKIPAHWEVKRTKFAATLRSGHTPSRQNPEYWKDCTIPWFGLADVWQIRDGQVEYVHVTAEKISEIGMANSAARLLPEGTVILSRTASVGFSAILGVDMATTQDFVNWICGPFLQPEYLLYVLRAMGSEFRRLKMGSTHQTIYMPDVGRFSTPVPPVLGGCPAGC